MAAHTGVKAKVRAFLEAGGQESVFGLAERFSCSRAAVYWALYALQGEGFCNPIGERVRGYGAPNHRNRMEMVWGLAGRPAVPTGQLVQHALQTRTALESVWGPRA